MSNKKRNIVIGLSFVIIIALGLLFSGSLQFGIVEIPGGGGGYEKVIITPLNPVIDPIDDLNLGVSVQVNRKLAQSSDGKGVMTLIASVDGEFSKIKQYRLSNRNQNFSFSIPIESGIHTVSISGGITPAFAVGLCKDNYVKSCSAEGIRMKGNYMCTDTVYFLDDVITCPIWSEVISSNSFTLEGDTYVIGNLNENQLPQRDWIAESNYPYKFTDTFKIYKKSGSSDESIPYVESSHDQSSDDLVGTEYIEDMSEYKESNHIEDFIFSNPYIMIILIFSAILSIGGIIFVASRKK